MRDGPDIAGVAALIGDPARANILTALMTGKALTATELAQEAGVTPQTASTHLARLTDGGLVIPDRQGRHRYFRLAGIEVATTLEALMGLAAGTGHLRTRPGPKDAALRHARVCYNHMAGDRGVQLYNALTASGHIDANDLEIPRLTKAGIKWATEFGIDLAGLEKSRAPMCRNCLDWSERRHHLGGKLGRAILATMENKGWVTRQKTGRALTFTQQGEAAFDQVFPKT